MIVFSKGSGCGGENRESRPFLNRLGEIATPAAAVPAADNEIYLINARLSIYVLFSLFGYEMKIFSNIKYYYNIVIYLFRLNAFFKDIAKNSEKPISKANIVFCYNILHIIA